jgi:hypothetical protein
MKCFTHVTPSHRRFLEEFFLPTATEFETVVCEGLQMGSSTYDTPGFELSMIEKTKSMLRAAQEPMGDIVLWSDVDIQFFAPCETKLIECLGSHDMAFQSAGPDRFCSGFFVFRVTDHVRALMRRVLEGLVSKVFYNDEPAMNEYARTVDYVRLPCGEFWTSGFCGGFLWDGNKDFLPRVRVPSSILVHHGNWCIGVERKLELMRYVRSVVLKRSQSPQA